jgi:HEAT repeat protein
VCDALGYYKDHARIIIPAMIERMRDEDPAVRWMAVRCIGGFDLPEEGVFPALVRALDDKAQVKKHDGDTVASVALWYLEHRGSEPANKKQLLTILPVIMREAQSNPYYPRLLAVRLLGHFGPDARKAVPLLILLLKEKTGFPENQEFALRFEVAVTLGKIGPAAREALPAVKAFARTVGIDRDPRREIEKAVGAIDKE